MFKTAVFRRDKARCRKCDEVGRLDAHHITDRHEMPCGGYVKENGISLCSKCHRKAEVWHESGKVEYEEGYHPDDLYKLIGSSYEEAFRASQKLGE